MPHKGGALRMIKLLRYLAGSVVVSAMWAAPCVAAYPDKPIRIVTPFPAGSVTDIVARPMAMRLSEAWGVPVVVDNRPGGGTVIATDNVAKSPPDGHTILLTPPSFVTNPALLLKLPYDSLRDFAPVSLLNINPQVLVVNPSVPARSAKELAALAKTRPGGMNCSSSGSGGANHLACELFMAMAGAKLVHVPYKGNAPALLAVATGEIDLSINSIIASMALIKGNRVRALAVSSLRRSAALPELPTLDEAGFKGYEAVAWAGFTVPAKTPAEIVARLNAAVVKIVHLPELKERMVADGSEPVGNSPAEFRAFLQDEIGKWRKIIQMAGLKAE